MQPVFRAARETRFLPQQFVQAQMPEFMSASRKGAHVALQLPARVQRRGGRQRGEPGDQPAGALGGGFPPSGVRRSNRTHWRAVPRGML